MNLNLPQTLPLLPGLRFEDHTGESHHKTQQFSVVNNTNCQQTNFIKEDIDPNLIDSLRKKTPLNLTYGSRRQPQNDYIPRIQPPWLKYDRQVLRFYGYFQQSVVEDPNENYRLRKCAIYFYLSDDTIHVNEPRVENSGLPQGVFIKRQKIPHKIGTTDSFFKWTDFSSIPLNVNFFERVFRIYDCDDFTREFFAYMGFDIPHPETAPIDNFTVTQARKDLKIPPPDTKEYKEYIEVKLGVGHPNGGLQKYLENDRKVLSFSILWQDNTLEGGTNFYTLNFFLADDTIEVKEIRKHNSGKDPFPLMLNRSKVPKQPILTHYPGMTLQKEEFYQPQDLLIGSSVRVFSKDCLIFDCNEFTRQWYRENLGIEMVPITIEQDRPKKFVHPVPPYNGYGTPEDSLGSVYNLQPKAPKKDVPQMYTQDQYILRYEARLVSKSKDDNVRQFLISFFCGDDTVMVYENSERNSGIWKGKFLERNKLVNPETKDYFKDQDFHVGKLIQVSVWTFQLLRPDQFTFNYMKDRAHLFPDADITHVLVRLKEMAQKYQNLDEFLIDFLNKADKQQVGYIGFIQLTQGLKELGFNLNYQEEYTLMKYFDATNQWKISMKHLFVGLGGKI